MRICAPLGNNLIMPQHPALCLDVTNLCYIFREPLVTGATEVWVRVGCQLQHDSVIPLRLRKHTPAVLMLMEMEMGQSGTRRQGGSAFRRLRIPVNPCQSISIRWAKLGVTQRLNMHRLHRLFRWQICKAELR
jgi:hypothetical protein